MVNTPYLETYKKNGWIIDSSIYDCLTDYEKSFVELELGTYKSLQFYKDRLSCLGFSNMDSVLDAGCGIGQWSIALANLNTKVHSIDLMRSRIEFAKRMFEKMGQKNVECQTGALEALPYPDQSFDAVFCYGVFMFTHVEKTLSEFHRVLKPGGKLYLNFNSFGWYAHLILDKGIKSRNFKLVWQAFRMCVRYFMGYNQQILIREHCLAQKLKVYGFKNITFASEGHLMPGMKPNQIKPKSIYQSHHYGMRSIIEVLGNK